MTTEHSSPVNDTALPPVEEIARVMWESDHEGSWDDPYANPAMTRHIYMGNAEVALAVVRQWRPAAPEPLNAAMDDMRDPEVASAMRAEQALNDLRDERAETTGYAERLAFALWEKHFREDAPDWKPLYGDLVGILTQIDNMTTGLSRAPAQRQPSPPKELHWLGDRESADATRHASDMTGCVMYFEQQSDCLQFMRWVEALSVTSTERHEETVPRRLLNERDDFIVNKGLWSEFMASLSSTDGTIQPHIYMPDYQAIGDCRVCGHEQDKPWHALTRLVGKPVDNTGGGAS